MFGIDAIRAYNGWAMALVGASIVFVGLVLLSFAVSRLHKILGLWQRRQGQDPLPGSNGTGSDTLNQDSGTRPLPPEIIAGIQQLQLLSERIGSPFPLPKMFDLAQKAGMLHSHSVANHALSAGILVPDGKGYFAWEAPSPS